MIKILNSFDTFKYALSINQATKFIFFKLRGESEKRTLLINI